ncbi:hypothetical protein LK07_21450 [Streptomyces pluripotens]|uniref:Uncharacterized protein n=1 Tax=Streptomyces pluripotens TaxID=1355015 RepID=A0A221P1P9_9ACTN|nr:MULTISPECIES: hypothetical protein [Streptomyces]ARP71903.1 hypothetical protein LK06_020295 [Streptomyces pluripotens]ASN26150.1 hypothetical protein LK07_21450 [Streptomyces pluripotens]KIE26320.1 hypothetical protein LK08_14005 [Streptomyces sp. MUSC 125]MCH0556391.1 hypothetical protein [Streptomyces sp. MUM 16J]
MNPLDFLARLAELGFLGAAGLVVGFFCLLAVLLGALTGLGRLAGRRRISAAPGEEPATLASFHWETDEG